MEIARAFVEFVQRKFEIRRVWNRNLERFRVRINFVDKFRGWGRGAVVIERVKIG